jgi:hypothetical protein
MERAKTDLQEHRSICPFTAKIRDLSQAQLDVMQLF